MQGLNEDVVRELLDKTGSIIKNHETFVNETGANYNIFEIADIDDKETTVCRILADLLSPAGRHGRKGAYLELFLHDCLKINLDTDEINKAQVYREYSTDKGRKIDIVIEVGGRFIPIEVKIYAREGDVQCYDYFQFAKSRDAKAKVVYLTLNGHFPSEYSAKELSENDILPISFAVDVLNWLEKCIALPETENKAPVREILIQFSQTIKKHTNQLEDKPKMEMLELLSESQQNMRNAKAVHGVFEACRAKIIKDFFNAIEEGIKNDIGLERESAVSHDYIANERFVNDFKYPGFNYIVGRFQDMDIIFRFEIDNNLFVGFGLAKNGERVNNSNIINSDEVLSLFEGVKKGQNSWWTAWDYIYFDNNKIDFKHYNDNYFKLFDSDKFIEIVESTIEQAKTTLGKLKSCHTLK